MTTLKFSKHQIPWSDCLVLIKDKDFILQKKVSSAVFLPTKSLNLSEKSKNDAIFIGEIDKQKLFALELSGFTKEDLHYVKVHSILDNLRAYELTAFYRACHLLNWHIHSRYCSTCGAVTTLDSHEFAKVCTVSSAHRHYPHYSPSMIVLVRHESKLLLGRSAHFPEGMYSTLAGFIEAGETVEEAVRREVMEEVGIEVKNIRPFSTAPWPFPNTLMLAYEAEASTFALKVDPLELEDAQWFSYNKLPNLPPKATIAFHLIEEGVRQCKELFG